MTMDSYDKLLETVLQEYKILTEYKRLQNEDLGGIYVIPSFDNSFLWFGVLFVRAGPYKDGVFRFSMTLPENFPNDSAVPAIVFQSEIFHPLTCPYSGALDLSEAFPRWKNGENHVWQLLKFVQYVFASFDEYMSLAEQSANNVAHELYHQNRTDFLQKVNECVKLSQSKLYDPAPVQDKNYILFERFDKETHGPVLESIKQGNTSEVTTPPTSGLSWVKEGVFQPLSK
ncbi:protein crossbronx homolog [Toxorhynchites rutilus septentrionalis]|uniref:protein crossbronx homolog n=1 Tax=Toxorhynchites rutilus septentrionalis TaxID=329112 RepID=UPI0024789751|nr:protein crossbronx homolog [Toxorhynchites rutilus septentrionalis]